MNPLEIGKIRTPHDSSLTQAALHSVGADFRYETGPSPWVGLSMVTDMMAAPPVSDPPAAKVQTNGDSPIEVGPGRQAIEELSTALGKSFITAPEIVSSYSSDSSRALPEGNALGLVLATSTQDVSVALAWADAHAVVVSVRGAGTDLSGGAIAYPGGLILCLEKMNRILNIDVENRLAEVEPGVTWTDLDQAARRYGLFFPPDPASAHTSTIGGNIATNAGDLRGVLHGVTTDAVASLEIVLAGGRVLRTGARTRTNVVGYDLISLFTGSEGTLGVITQATVRLKPIPPGVPVAFWASFDQIEDAGVPISELDQTAREVHQAIKRTLDPRGIFTPGRVI